MSLSLLTLSCSLTDALWSRADVRYIFSRFLHEPNPPRPNKTESDDKNKKDKKGDKGKGDKDKAKQKKGGGEKKKKSKGKKGKGSKKDKKDASDPASKQKDPNAPPNETPKEARKRRRQEEIMRVAAEARALQIAQDSAAVAAGRFKVVELVQVASSERSLYFDDRQKEVLRSLEQVRAAT